MKPVVILIALLVLAAGLVTGCGVSKDSYDDAINQLNELSTQVNQLNAQLSEAQAGLTAAQDDLSARNAELATAQNNLTKANADLATAQQDLDEVLADRDSILAQLDEAEADLAVAQAQLESVDPLITTLQSENEQLKNIAGLSLYETKANAVTIHQTNGVYSTVISFTADYAGYVVVSGTSTSVNGYIYVEDSFNGYPYNDYLHYFVTGTTLKIPVLPGTVGVFFTNTDPIGATAVITVVYYY